MSNPGIHPQPLPGCRESVSTAVDQPSASQPGSELSAGTGHRRPRSPRRASQRRTFFWPLVAALLTAAFGSPLTAQEVPPALFSEMDEETDKREPLVLTSVAVEARLFGYLAETRMTMTFANPHDRTLAGDLYFPLPEGATISGYALDLQGRMVDGVVVEKAQGRQVFEKILRQGIDPGLVEWVKGNNFKTRLFPIPARGSRTVRVEYVGQLVAENQEALYHLPLNFAQPVEHFSLRLEVVRAIAAPQVRQGGLANLHFGKWRDSFVAETEIENATLTEDLIVALPEVERQPVLVEQDEEGTVHFAISDLPPSPDLPDPSPPRRITLLWDASGSRGKKTHDRELSLLRDYLARFPGTSIDLDLILFRNAAEAPRPFRIEHGDSADLLTALAAVAYDGGTQMGAISPPPGAVPPDLYLLFTDGLSNLGAEEPAGFTQPVYILSADPQTNHPFLRHLATRTGGAYFNLQRMADREVLANIGRTGFGFIAVEADSAAIQATCPTLRQPVHGRFFLTGRLVAEQAEIAILYGTGGQVTHRSRYRISRQDATQGDLLRRFWAQNKVAELSAFPQRHLQELVALGKRYGLVTPGTSLIVLESLEQYVEHQIPPPASLPEMRQQYDELLAQHRQQEQQKKEDKLQYVLSLWQQRVEWWKKDFAYPENFKYQGEAGADSRELPGYPGEAGAEDRREAGFPDETGAEDRREAPAENSGESESPGLLGRALSLFTMGGQGGQGAPEEVAAPRAASSAAERELAAVEPRLAALKSAGGEGENRADEPAIAIVPWNPDTPYLKELRQAAPEKRFATYLKQRREFGAAPSFYLDCANFFFAQKEETLALQILSNVAELELENAALLRVLAHRLAQLDRLDLSLGLFEQVLALRPEEPQSHRDLALILTRRAAVSPSTARADYARAIELLYQVLIRPWDRFAEIEAIALMELNRLIPLARQAGVEAIPIDPRLVDLLDVDLRLVLTWDADLTDMDLWVIEPSGEKAFYSHPLTTIGGHLSRDFTDGYGPEEYCVKKAQHGEYKIQANYYGSSAPALSGAVTLQAEVFTHYGRPTEQRQAITVRLTGTKDTIEIGVVEF